MKPIGFIQQLAFTCAKKTDATKTNPDLFRRVSNIFPDARLDEFGSIQGTYESVMKGLSKFDNDATFNVSREEVLLTIDTIKQMFPQLESRFNTITHKEVLDKMPDETSSGATMSMNGLKKKIDAISKYISVIIAQSTMPNHIPLFRGSGKAERIIREKIMKDDVRLFISSPIEFVWKGMLLFSDFSNYIKQNAEDPQVPIKIGMEMINNSLLAFFERLSVKNWKIASDVSKWDGRFLNEMFDIIAHLKCWMHNPNDSLMTQEEYKKQVYHYYSILKRPCVAMPDGNIYQLQKGQMSGVYTTSQDNSLAHTIIMVLVLLRSMGQEQLLKHWRNKEIELGLVGDDNCSGVPIEIPFELRQKTYLDCGMILKPSMEFCSQDINGISFLSFTYKDKKVFFNRNKILCSIVHEPAPNPSHQEKCEIYTARIGNLTILAAFDEPLCNFLINLYQEMRAKYNCKWPPPYPLDVNSLQNIWKGCESNA